MQTSLIAGDSLSVLVSGGAHPASAGWVLKMTLVPRVQGPSVVVITAAAEGDDHRLQVGKTATTAWQPGQYAWAQWVEKGDEAKTLDRGQITIQPDPRTMPVGTDTRSQAVQALESCKTALADFRAGKGLKRRYKIGEREMEFTSTAEVLREIKFWQNQVDAEEVAAGRKSSRAGVIKARI
jgi:enamine deaminase RidA (YjgF/YER057c/UK114 family)